MDNNCDGNVDEGVTTTIYIDADGDGYGNENLSEEACSIRGYSPNGTDCDDINDNVFPTMMNNVMGLIMTVMMSLTMRTQILISSPQQHFMLIMMAMVLVISIQHNYDVKS